MRVRKKTKLSIEGYIAFSQFRQYDHLSNDNLNQILEMNGFRKIYKPRKKELIDAVDSIELVDLSRSTLVEDDEVQAMSSRAFITMEEVVGDLADLNWQECFVTSLESVNVKPSYFRNLNSNVYRGLQNDQTLIPKRKRSRRKMLSLSSLDRLNNFSCPALATRIGNGGGFDSTTERVRKKLACRRKMIVRSDDETESFGFRPTTGSMTKTRARRSKLIGRSDDETESFGFRPTTGSMTKTRARRSKLIVRSDDETGNAVC